MKQVLYNSNTEKVSTFYQNGYPIAIPEHEQGYIHVLNVIEPEPPAYNPATQKLTSDWVIDLDNNEYVRVYTVIDKSEQELELEDWDFLERAERVRVMLEWLDPEESELNPANKKKLEGLVQFWQVGEYNHIRRNGFFYIYFDNIDQKHRSFLNTLGAVFKNRPEAPLLSNKKR